MSRDREDIKGALYLLDRTIDFIQRGWTQKASARTVGGEAIIPLDDDACSWCLFGAIRKASSLVPDNLSSIPYIISYRAVADEIGDPELLGDINTITNWNDQDERTATEVVRLLEDTKDRVRKELPDSY